jgi:nitrogen fixation protein
MSGPIESSTSQEAVVAVASPADRLLRSARALIGWLPDDRALGLLNSNEITAQISDDQRALVAAARAAVQHRDPGVDQTDLIEELAPSQLEDHVAQLRVGVGAVYFDEGWRIALVDLPRVCAFQPTVFTDSALERAAGIDPRDLSQVAGVSLPTEWRLEQQAQFDPTRNQFLLVSRNPNLRIVGHFAGPLKPGDPPAFGFLATIMPSFLQVAAYQGRYFLRDGYHRSIGLLSIGARHVPAFVRQIDSMEQLVPAGMLPQEAFMGDRPPTLADYADESVSTSVQLPASQKMIVVQALELSPQG